MSSDIFYTGMDEMQLLNMVFYVFSVAVVISLVMTSVMYVLNALGLYKVARRRGIPHPWLAWIPLGDYWVLGSIADHYHRECHKEVRNLRVVMVLLFLASTVISLIQIFYTFSLAETMMNAASIDVYELERMMMDYEQQVGSYSAIGTVSSLMNLAGMVIYYICLHDFYASCRPANKNVFLVLSIIFSATVPFFVFYCRHADLGMPSRDEQQECGLPPAQTTESDTQDGIWKDS